MKKIFLILICTCGALSAMEDGEQIVSALTGEQNTESPITGFGNFGTAALHPTSQNPIPDSHTVSIETPSRSDMRHHGFNNSYEQRLCFYLCGLGALAEITYEAGRVTPQHVHELIGSDISHSQPLFGDLFSNQPIPEREALSALVPFCCMLACARTGDPDHSCCYDGTLCCGNSIRLAAKKVYATLRGLKDNMFAGDRYVFGEWGSFELGTDVDDGNPLVPGLFGTGVRRRGR